MSRFEGLNLAQLLDLLNDLVRPEPVAWTPQTIGWAIAGLWLLSLVLLVAWDRVRYLLRNRYRRDALAALQEIAEQADQSNAAAAQQIALLLKRTALVAYSRTEVASLYGADWAAFIRCSAGNDPVVEGAAGDLATAAYRADADGKKLVAPARRWIKVHRA